VLLRLFNPEPKNRLGNGGIAALPTLLNRRSHSMTFSRRKWIIACGIVAVASVLLLVRDFLGAQDEKAYDGCQNNAELRKMNNWEIEELATSPLGTRISPYIIKGSQTIRLTESVRSNLWTTTLLSDIGLPENSWQTSEIYLTLNQSIQDETEKAVKWGLAEYGASAGLAIVMDAKTGAVVAMVLCPEPDTASCYGGADNRAICHYYEPGSVLSVITAAAAMDSNTKYNPMTYISTSRDDAAYYRLPGDGSRQWESRITLADAINRSCNIAIGKVSYDIGPYILYKYMRLFGFGLQTGIELPGEFPGILMDPHEKLWDEIQWSRVGIGQGVAVTAIQLVGAYQVIANEGVRMKPYIIERIVDHRGGRVLKQKPMELGRAISAKTARELRYVLKYGVSAYGTAPIVLKYGVSACGTAPIVPPSGRCSVAGKAGTAPKVVSGRYSDSQFCATFCGMVPASEPQLVILVTLDFDEKRKSYRSGDSAGLVFKRIVQIAIPYFGIHPDEPDNNVKEKLRNVAINRQASASNI